MKTIQFLIVSIFLSICHVYAQPVVTSPQEGDVWYAGETNTIKWEVRPNSRATVFIGIGDGMGQLSWVGFNVPNNGSYSWAVSNPWWYTNVVLSISDGGNATNYTYIHMTIPNGPRPPQPYPDLSILTNHAALVGHQFKKVEGVMVGFYAYAAAQDHQPNIFYPYTNTVKTLESIMAMVTNRWWSLPVVDTNAPISISVQFYDTNDGDVARGNGAYSEKGGGSQARVLFNGNSSGTPRQNQAGQWVLPDYAQEVQMRLAYNVFITMTNIASAHFVYTNQYGGYSSFDLGTDYGNGFWFNSDFAGQGILVLGSWTPQIYNNETFLVYKESAYNLALGGKEVPITGVLVRALIEDSDDFKSSVNATDLDISVYSYNGYGKVPLLIATYTNDAPSVYISVHTVGDYATSFIIEDQTSGTKTMINVPTGSTGVNVSMPKGVYHIIPQGLNLKVNGYGGGKG